MPGSEAAATDATAKVNAGLAAGADRLRGANQWLIGSAGAVAAVVFAGISISGLNGVEGSYRRIAIVAAIVALVSIIGALVTTMWLAGASTVTVLDLEQPVGKTHGALRAAIEAVSADPELKPWDGDITKFTTECGEARAQYLEFEQMWVGDPAVNAESTFVERARVRDRTLESTKRVLLEGASYIRLRHSFGTAGKLLFGTLVAAALAVVTFAWATSQPGAVRAPAISADFKNADGQFLLEGKVNANGIRRNGGVRIRVYDTVGGKPRGAAKFSADVGPDSTGNVDHAITVPMSALAAHQAVIKAWVKGSGEPSCPGGGARQSCLIVSMPSQPPRAELSATVAGAVLNVHVRAAALASDQVVAFNVYGTRPQRPDPPVYRAILTANGGGSVDETLAIPVPVGMDMICAAAKTVPAAAYVDPTCAPPIDPDVAWAQIYELAKKT